MVQVIETIEDLRRARARLSGLVGLVPTMGALHAGHVALVEQARRECDSVIVTIFVNPTQFGPNEDLDAYPRDLPGDLAKLEQAGVDLVFTPMPDIIYPPDFQTVVLVEGVSQGLEGEHRPGHFRGVATVVGKLFNLTQPHRAYFGQKDAQQAAVIRQMVRDLNFPLELVIHPIVREADGLALSSRNAYLNPQERQAATVLYRALRAAVDRYEAGERDPEALRGAMRAVLAAEPLAEVAYVSAADADTLAELHTPSERPVLLSMAVRIGRTRLIDNWVLGSL